MSDPVADLKRELLAAAERRREYEVPTPLSPPRWLERLGAGRRRRRLAAFAVAALVVVVGTASAIGGVRDFVLDRGFIGLPPEGASPSAPQSGELVVFWGGLSATLPRNLVRASLYADGRIIWERRPWHEDPTAGRPAEGANELVSGYLEQRLTPEGVELVRSEVARLFDRTRGALETFPADEDPWPGPGGRRALFVPDDHGSAWGSVEVRAGGERVRLQWRGVDTRPFVDLDGTVATGEQLSALGRVDALLTDPGSVLPRNAWAVRKVRAYVPSHYAVCIETAPPVEASRILSMLPAPAAELLRDEPRTRSVGDLLEGREGGRVVVIGRSVTDCYRVETEQAREVADAVSGLRREPGWGRYGLAYRVPPPAGNLTPTRLRFEPYLPDGQIPFSGPAG